VRAIDSRPLIWDSPRWMVGCLLIDRALGYGESNSVHRTLQEGAQRAYKPNRLGRRRNSIVNRVWL